MRGKVIGRTRLRIPAALLLGLVCLAASVPLAAGVEPASQRHGTFSEGVRAAVSSSGTFGEVVAVGTASKLVLQDGVGSEVWSHPLTTPAALLRVSDSGNAFVLSTLGNQIQTFQRPSGTPVWSYQANSTVIDVQIDPTGNHVAAIIAAHTLLLFDFTDGTPQEVVGIDGAPTVATFSHDGGYIAVGNDEGVTSLFRTEDGAALWSKEHSGAVSSVAVDQSTTHVLIGTSLGKAFLYERTGATATLLWQMQLGGGNARVLLSGDGTTAVVGSDGDSLRIVDAATGGIRATVSDGANTHTLQGSEGLARLLVRTTDGKMVLIDSPAGTTRWIAASDLYAGGSLRLDGSRVVGWGGERLDVFTDEPSDSGPGIELPKPPHVTLTSDVLRLTDSSGRLTWNWQLTGRTSGTVHHLVAQYTLVFSDGTHVDGPLWRTPANESGPTLSFLGTGPGGGMDLSTFRLSYIGSESRPTAPARDARVTSFIVTVRASQGAQELVVDTQTDSQIAKAFLVGSGPQDDDEDTPATPIISLAWWLGLGTLNLAVLVIIVVVGVTVSFSAVRLVRQRRELRDRGDSLTARSRVQEKVQQSSGSRALVSGSAVLPAVDLPKTISMPTTTSTTTQATAPAQSRKRPEAATPTTASVPTSEEPSARIAPVTPKARIATADAIKAAKAAGSLERIGDTSAEEPAPIKASRLAPAVVAAAPQSQAVWGKGTAPTTSKKSAAEEPSQPPAPPVGQMWDSFGPPQRVMVFEVTKVRYTRKMAMSDWGTLGPEARASIEAATPQVAALWREVNAPTPTEDEQTARDPPTDEVPEGPKPAFAPMPAPPATLQAAAPAASGAPAPEEGRKAVAKLRCPSCKRIFPIYNKEKGAQIDCPHCSYSATI